MTVRSAISLTLLLPWMLLALVLGCPGSLVTDDDDVAGDDDTATDDDDDLPDGFALTVGDWRLPDEIGSLVYVSWEQNGAADARVEYSFEEGEWLTTPPFEAGEGEHEQILLGIPFDTEAQWRVVAGEGDLTLTVDGEPLSTGPLPPGLPVGVITYSDPTAHESTGNFLLSSICQELGGWDPGNYWTFIVDREGRPVWAQVAPNEHWTLFAQVSKSGTSILWDESTYWLNWGANHGIGSLIHRQYLDEEIETYPADGIVHAFVELPDGTLAWGSEYHVPNTEALVELAPGADEVEVIWTCAEGYPGSPNAYCSSNGLFYEASTDTYLYSFWDESVVLEVDRATGDNLWWAGDVAGGYGFDPPESAFTFQHGISYTYDGTLLLHSGGYGMGAQLMVREYEVDHDDQTLYEIWNSGEETDVSGVLNGDVWRLPGGNTLHTLGSGGMVKEIAPDLAEVWVLDFQGEHLMGASAMIEDLYALVAPQP